MGWDRDPGGVLRPSSIAGAIEIQRETKEETLAIVGPLPRMIPFSTLAFLLSNVSSWSCLEKNHT
jgi:hypothetical protein